jgi:cyanophycinase
MSPRAIPARSFRFHRCLGGALLGLLTGACTSAGERSEAVAPGGLVIVGGGLRASNEAIIDALLGGLGEGRLGIVPAASSRPSRNAARFRDLLVARGVEAERIVTLPLATEDDPGTPDLDESAWRTNGARSDLARQIGELRAIWFIGGDQARIAEVLQPPGGDDTPVLRAIRDLHARGRRIGGTSAGAAVQSDPMILGGSSPEALAQGMVVTYPGMAAQEEGPLVLGRGFGFFPHGIIDQHFDRKGRLGRLVVAVTEPGSPHRVGFGIDEDTALLYDAASATAEVVGSGSVVVVDAREAEGDRPAWQNLRLSVLTAGDRLRWPGPEIRIDPRKTPTVGREYLDLPNPRASGPIAPYGGRLEDVLGFLLLDNAGAAEVASGVAAANGRAFHFRFAQDARSQGYYATLDGEYVRYSAVDVRLSVE